MNAKIATHDVLPALITLGSDPNLLVKHSSIEAFGAVAQHFKDEVVCCMTCYKKCQWYLLCTHPFNPLVSPDHGQDKSTNGCFLRRWLS